MNIDKVKLNYYLSINKKHLYKLKHDSHFLQLLGKNIDFINDPILNNILNDINAIIDFLLYAKSDENKYNFLLIPSIRQKVFNNTFQTIIFEDDSYYEKLFLNLSEEEKNKFYKYIKGNYLPIFLKNHFSFFGEDKVFDIIMNSWLDDKSYEMFLPYFKDNVKIKGILLKIKNPLIKGKYFDMLPIYEKKRCIIYLPNKLDYINDKELLPYIIASVGDEKLIFKYYSSLSFEDKLIVLENIKLNEDLQIYLLNHSLFNTSQYLYALKVIIGNINDPKLITDLYEKINIDVIKKIQNSNIPSTDDNFYMDPNIDNKIKFGIELECSNPYYDLLLKFKKFGNWNIVSEASVKNGIEFTSPIYHYDKKSLQDLKNMCSFLNKNNFTYRDEAAGHIHFDINIFSNVKELMMFYKIFCNNEDILFLIFNRPNSVIRDNVEKYAVPISKSLNNNIVNSFHPKFSEIEQFISFVHYSQNGKYSSININNVFDNSKNTIEIRCPNIEMNFEYLHENLMLISYLIMVSKNASKEDKYSKNNILINMFTVNMPIEKRKDILLKLLFSDNNYLYNIFDYRFKRNLDVNKDTSFIKDNTSHLTF